MNEPISKKRPLSFCVVVESNLPEDEACDVLNALLNAGLAEAARTVESDIDGELGQLAQDASDMDVHAPSLMELPPLSTFPPRVPAAEAALRDQCASLPPDERVHHVVTTVLCDGTVSLHRALRIAFPEAADAPPPAMDIPNTLLAEQLQAWVNCHVREQSPAPRPAMEPPLAAGESMTVYIEAYAERDDVVGPSLVALEVDNVLLNRLTSLHTLCVDDELPDVFDSTFHEEWSGNPKWGPHGIEDELRICNPEWMVTRGGVFWCQAEVKVVEAFVPNDEDYRIASRKMSIADLIERIRSAKAQGDDHVVGGDWSQEDADKAIAAHREAIAAASSEALRP